MDIAYCFANNMQFVFETTFLSGFLFQISQWVFYLCHYGQVIVIGYWRILVCHCHSDTGIINIRLHPVRYQVNTLAQ